MLGLGSILCLVTAKMATNYPVEVQARTSAGYVLLWLTLAEYASSTKKKDLP